MALYTGDATLGGGKTEHERQGRGAKEGRI